MPNGTVRLSATVKDSAGQTMADHPVTWLTSQSTVAGVDSTGLVTGLTTGEAAISATAGTESDTARITVFRSGHYVAPDGSPDGDGTVRQPWSLSVALAGGRGQVRPADTIWVRAGTYRGGFISTVSGAPNEPITIRAYPRERAIIDGGSATGDNFVVRGEWTVFRDLELMSSNPNRNTSSTGSGWRPTLLVNNASHTKYVNLVIHDGGVAFFTFTNAADVEVYGCIIYNNGWQGGDRGHGHGLYTKSSVGPLVLRSNVVFNQFGYGIHAFTEPGTGQLNNIEMSGNVSFNNGTLSADSASSNILLGGNDYSTGGILRDNLTYFSPGVAGTNVRVGYDVFRNGSVRLVGNTIVGGAPALDLGFWTVATVSANRIIGSGLLLAMHDPATVGYSWTDNLHHRDPTAAAWSYAGTAYPFAIWQAAARVGVSDRALPGRLAGALPIVLPNVHEPGRATVVVFNWDRLPAVAVDLSGVLVPGDRYQVQDVQDLWGPAVAQGTYQGGSIELPQVSREPPTPIGLPASSAPRTGPEFNVFLIRRLSE